MKNLIIVSFLLFSSIVLSSVEDLKNDQKGFEKLMLQIDESGQSINGEFEEVGNYRVKKVGKKFVAVMSKINKPLDIFDLSLNALNWKEDGIGGFQSTGL
jgi:hypothetical protein